MDNKEIYRKLETETERLYSPVKEQLPQFITEIYHLYIAPYLERIPLVKAKEGYKSAPLSSAISNDEVLLQTIKVIGLMEASENLEEFKTLTQKQKKNTPKKKKEKEKTDFDNILGAMMKVPKPGKKEKVKEKQKK